MPAMSSKDLQQPVTMEDLLNFKQDLMRDMVQAISQKLLSKLPVRKGYSIKEFSQLTGLEETTINIYCLTGKLKAKQIVKGGSWMILTTELDRLINEAVANHFNDNEKRPGKRDKVILKKLGIDIGK